MNETGQRQSKSSRQLHCLIRLPPIYHFLRNNLSRRATFTLLLFVACFLLAGCAHFRANQNYIGPSPLPEEIRDHYSHNRSEGPFLEKILTDNDQYTLKRIEFSSTNNILPLQHNIYIDYYDVKTEGPTPVIMVLPILGGKNLIAKAFASYFAENGYAAVIVHRQKHYKKNINLETINDTFRQIVLDHKQAIDWIERRPELDHRKIGVFGVSMGGIKSALISALDTRVRASVIALAAGDIPHVLSYSNEKGIVKRRNRILAEKNLTLGEFHGQLSKTVNCDPLNYAHYMDASNVLMILAIFDSTVPYAKGVELRERMGSPETIYLFAGHYTSFLYIDYIKAQSLQFYDNRFSLEEKLEITGNFDIP